MKKWFWALPLLGLAFSSCTAPIKGSSFAQSASGSSLISVPGVSSSQAWEGVVRSLNETSDFDLSFLADVSPKDLSGYGLWPGFGGEFYCAKKYAMSEGRTPQEMLEAGSSILYYVVSAYPDYLDGGSFVTGIVCSDPAVRLSGHALGSSDAMKESLVDVGFVPDSGTGSSASDPEIFFAGRLKVTLVKARFLSCLLSSPTSTKSFFEVEALIFARALALGKLIFLGGQSTLWPRKRCTTLRKTLAFGNPSIRFLWPFRSF